MNIESQREQTKGSSEKLILGIQRELIFESCGKDRRKQAEWIEKNSERFRQIVEQYPELIWEYPQTKNKLETFLYGETIH
jgi:hypothetical protein